MYTTLTYTNINMIVLGEKGEKGGGGGSKRRFFFCTGQYKISNSYTAGGTDAWLHLQQCKVTVFHSFLLLSSSVKCHSGCLFCHLHCQWGEATVLHSLHTNVADVWPAKVNGWSSRQQVYWCTITTLPCTVNMSVWHAVTTWPHIVSMSV